MVKIAAMLSVIINGQIMGDLVHPGREFSGAVIILSVLEYAVKNILHQILTNVLPAAIAVKIGKKRLIISLKEKTQFICLPFMYF
jgi:hypothetical protein